MNETQEPFPTIHAEYDPEGNVHYLFGIAYGGDEATYKRGVEQLQKQMNEGEFEVFIDYGKEYEKVRKRKGYAIMSDRVRKKFELEIEKDEREYLEEISEFEAEDIGMVLDYFSGPFFVDSLGNNVEALSTGVKKRILTVLENMELRLKALSSGTTICTRKRRRLEENYLLEEQLNTLNSLRHKIELVGCL